MLSDAKRWFKEAGFGMMIHWGLYALPAGEWGGRRTDQIGEWTQSYFRIPMAEYEKLAREQSQELYDLVRRLQPDCLINSRLGNGLGDYRSMGDNEVSETDFGDELVETPATLNDTWGYKSFDNNWKSADEICRIRSYLAQRGVNYLLNVGPDALGRIPAPSQNILREVGRRTSG